MIWNNTHRLVVSSSISVEYGFWGFDSLIEKAYFCGTKIKKAKIMKTTNKAKRGIGAFYTKKAQQALRDGIAAIIEKMKESGKTTLCTETKSTDAESNSVGNTIYAYVLDDEMHEVSEWEVKGLRLTDKGELLVLVDDTSVQYTPEDVNRAFDNRDTDIRSLIYTLWYGNSMFYDDMLQTDMTAMCILRDIDPFLNE